MGSPSNTSGGPPSRGRFLGEGDVIAERFRIDRFEGPGIVGENYLATDTRNDRPVAIHVLSADVLKGPNALDRVKAEMRSASQLTHKNVVTTYGMGQLKAGAVYIIGEHVEGNGLDELLRERRRQNKIFSLRGAYSIVAHLCNALAFAHKSRIHGSLSTKAVAVSVAGRVKIRDFPMSRLLYTVPSFRKSVPAYVQKFWAPEITGSSSVITHKADVYSLGVILYELLTGMLPEGPGAKVTRRRPDIPAQIDAIVARCLDTEPANRFKSVSAFKEELATLLESVSVETEQEEGGGLDIEIDVDRPLSAPPPPAQHAPAPPAAAAEPPPPARLSAPSEPPVVPQPEPTPSSPGLPDIPVAAVEDDEDRPSLGPLNLDAIMASVQDQDAEKWMITKQKMDHGPFKTREVVQMIVRWEVEGQHMIQDIETGIRVKLRESGNFKEIVERSRVTKVKHEEQMALEQSAKAEKRGGFAKIFVVLIVVGAIGLVVGSIFAVRAILPDKEEDEQDIDELIASGELKIDMGQGGILKDKKGRKGKRKGGGGGSAGSYDDYMNQAVDLGDLVGDGGQVQLSQQQINQVMSTKGKAVYPCIYKELKVNRNLKKVSLKFAIEGPTGSVKGVTVTSPASSELKSCISQKMKKVKFPKFSAPRMGATFFFNVG